MRHTLAVTASIVGIISFACTESKQSELPAPPSPTESKKAIAAALDDFHRAAAEPNEERYFSHFASGGVFLGTDPAERWTVAQFREYAHTRFATGKGWTYLPSARNIDLASDGNVAWFDEVVTNEKYGACRGTGILLAVDGIWKIAQYSLSLPLPNDMFGEVAERVKVFE